MNGRLDEQPRLGVAANAAQFGLLLCINVCVGALVGQDRVLVPLMGQAFGIRTTAAALAFVVAFGFSKAVSNLVAGAMADNVGRRRLLVAGWLVGLTVPPLLMWAPSWGWVVFASVLLGINQGLTWSLAVIMKVDLAGPRWRGLATGLNEAGGYAAVAVSAWLTGALAARHGIRPEPLFLGVAVALIGLGLSVLARDTGGHVRTEMVRGEAGQRSLREVLALASYRDRQLAVSSRAGLATNATDAVAWGLLPILFVRAGLGVWDVGLLAGLAAGTWGLAQVVTGPLSDRVGRRSPIAAGLWMQAVALVGFIRFDGLAGWSLASIAYGLGTALVYPTLLAAVADLAAPPWRAKALGVYRLWRDGGYVAGALVAGLIADGLGLGTSGAIIGVAVAATAAGVDVWWNLGSRQVRMEAATDGRS